MLSLIQYFKQNGWKFMDFPKYEEQPREVRVKALKQETAELYYAENDDSSTEHAENA